MTKTRIRFSALVYHLNPDEVDTLRNHVRILGQECLVLKWEKDSDLPSIELTSNSQLPLFTRVSK